eukprot:196843_1
MSTYTWKITDPSLVEQMKNAKNERGWTSPTFSASGFRWYCIVYPNGIRKSATGYVGLYLYLSFVPPKVKSISIGFELRLLETDTYFNANRSFDKDNTAFGWTVKRVAIKHIQHLSTLTFTTKVDVHGAIDHEDNDITNWYISTD